MTNSDNFLRHADVLFDNNLFSFPKQRVVCNPGSIKLLLETIFGIGKRPNPFAVVYGLSVTQTFLESENA